MIKNEDFAETSENDENDINPVDKISPEKRRFDSLAWLIQGDAKCGAAAFDGRNLLLATNDDVVSNLALDVIDVLHHISKEMYDNRNENEEVKRNIWEKIKVYLEGFYKFANQRVNLLKTNSEYNERFYTSLYKVARLIRGNYFKNKVLLPDLVNAIKEKRIIFIENTTLNWNDINNDLHAEMKIVEYLFQTNYFDSDQGIYIGISKKCCLNCENVIKAINNSYENSIEVRSDGHEQPFRAGIPPFLNKWEDINQEFLRISQEKEKFKANRVNTVKEAFDRPAPKHITHKTQAQDKSRSYERSTESDEKDHNKIYRGSSKQMNTSSVGHSRHHLFSKRDKTGHHKKHKNYSASQKTTHKETKKNEHKKPLYGRRDG